MQRPSQGRPAPGSGGGKVAPRPSSRPSSSAELPRASSARPAAVRSTDQSTSSRSPAAGSTASSSTASRPARPAAGASSSAARRPTSAASAPPERAATDRGSPKSGQVALRVYTQSKRDDIGIVTLLGDYIENGMNHGRKCYQKKDQGKEDYEVHLYYWDKRDGADFSGWWFGSAVGGSEVWSRCESHDQKPPTERWRVPWDKPVSDLLLIEHLSSSSSPASRGSVSSGPGRERPSREANNGRGGVGPSREANRQRVELAGERVGDVEAETQRIIESGRQMCEPPVSTSTLEEVEQKIMAQQKLVGETQKSLQQDINEAKSADEDPGVLNALSKLGTRLRALQTSLTSELGQAKGLRSEMQEKAKRRAAEKEQQKRHEEEDAQVLQQLLPEAMDQVTQVEDAIETTEILAAPLKATDESSSSSSAVADEENAKIVDDVDQAAMKAQDSLTEAKKNLKASTDKAINFRSGQARKTAASEFSTLQQRIRGLEERLAPLKKFKKEYSDAQAAKKALGEIQSMIGTAELEVEKARIMGASAMDEQMTKEDIRSAEELLEPAKKSIDSARQNIDRKLRSATSVFLTKELEKAQERANKARAMLEDTASKLHAQRDGLALQQLVEEGNKKVEKAEYSLHDTSEAEMPFLKGIEVLPYQEAMDAVKACEEAAGKAEVLVQQAKKFLNTQGSQKFSKAISKKASDELSELSTRLTEVSKKLASFNKDTAQRRAQALLSEISEKVNDAEAQVQFLGEVTKLFTSKKLEDVTIDSLQATCDQSTAAEKEAVATMNEAQRQLASKKKEFSVTQQREGAEGAVLAKLHKRLGNANEDLAKHRKIASYGQNLIKARENVDKARAMIKQTEASMEKLIAAEAPFLKGLEVLPHDEAYQLFYECENAAEQFQKVVTEARTFINAKHAEAKHMPDEVGKAPSEEFAKMMRRVNEMRTKLETFKQDTDSRRKKTLMEEAKSKLEKLDKEVQAATEAARPLAEDDPEKISQQVASQVCEKLAVLDKTTQKHMDECRSFLRDRQVDVKGNAENTEVLNALTGRLGALQTQLTKTKRAASEHEQRFVAKKLVREATDLVKEVEAEVKRVEAQTAPLTQERGQKLLVAERILAVVEALSDHMEKSQKTVDDLFKEISGKVKDGKEVADNNAKASFAEYLDKLPSELDREDLTYSSVQRDEMFAHIVSEHAGEFTLASFQSLFLTRYSCVEKISVTDIFEINKSKSVTKLEVDQVVEAVSRPRLSEKLGVERIEVKLENGTTGWVTMKGNHGTSFLAPFSPYTSFVQSMDRVFETAFKSVSKASNFVKTKVGELASCTQGPLAQARADLDKLKPRVSAAQKGLDSLKSTMSEAKREYTKSQESEKRSQQEARDRKVADAVLNDLRGKVAAMETGAKRLADAIKPLASASGATLEAVPNPLSITSSAEELVTASAKDCEAVRECVKGHRKAVVGDAKASKGPGPLSDARQELTRASSKADKTEKQNAQSLESVKMACKALAEARILQIANALRQELQTRQVTIEALFAELAAGQETISEEAFLAHVGTLGLAIPEEHGRLLVMHLDPGGVGRRSFQKMIQLYYAVVKPITITEDFQISKSKTVRHLEVGEILELLEGPSRLEKPGITRIKAKALTDDAVGWISVKGNQGTPFLEEAPKPYYSCSAEVRLEKAFESREGPENLVRTLRPHDVLEVLAGPRLEEVTAYASKAKAKACSDGATGYITVKSREGVINAEKGVYFTCTSAIAITDNRNIRTCKVLRKLAVGEVFSVLEGPIEEEGTTLRRAKIRATTDKQEGWVTTTGNAGTVYASESTRHYTVLVATALQKGFRSQDAEKVRELAVGEPVEILETPKDEKPEEVIRLQGRVLSDGAVGWVTLRCGTRHYLSSSSLMFKCTSPVDVHSALPSADSPVIRQLDEGEKVELLGGPFEEKKGVLRIKARADKDGAVGFITLKGESGAYLTPVKPK